MAAKCAIGENAGKHDGKGASNKLIINEDFFKIEELKDEFRVWHAQNTS